MTAIIIEYLRANASLAPEMGWFLFFTGAITKTMTQEISPATIKTIK